MYKPNWFIWVQWICWELPFNFAFHLCKGFDLFFLKCGNLNKISEVFQSLSKGLKSSHLNAAEKKQAVEVGEHTQRAQGSLVGLGRAGGTRSPFLSAQHFSGQLGSSPKSWCRPGGFYCPQHSTFTEKFCIACAFILNAVWNEPAEGRSVTFEVWTSVSLESALVHSPIRAITFSPF